MLNFYWGKRAAQLNMMGEVFVEKQEDIHISDDQKKFFSFCTDYSLGIFLGFVLGFIISKIYQIQAIVYRDSQYDRNLVTSWYEQSPPTWITATESPNSFSMYVVTIFIIISILFTYFLRRRFQSVTRNE